MSLFAKLKRTLFSVSLTCNLCGREIFEGYFCAECEGRLKRIADAKCDNCGRSTAEAERYCLECKRSAPEFDKARSVFEYEGGIVSLIYKLKNGDRYLAELFGEYMSRLVFKEFVRADEIIDVPLYKADLRARGYNQAQLLAKNISKATGVPYAEGAIEKVKPTEQNKTLNKRERLKNLEGAFRVTDKSRCTGKSFLLIDDVLTTGATADVISGKLKNAGAERVYLLTAASVKNKSIIV